MPRPARAVRIAGCCGPGPLPTPIVKANIVRSSAMRPDFSRSEGCRRGKRPNGREEVSRGRGGFWLAKTFGIAAVACGASLEYEVVVGLNEIEASADLTDAAAKWSQRPTR